MEREGEGVAGPTGARLQGERRAASCQVPARRAAGLGGGDCEIVRWKRLAPSRRRAGERNRPGEGASQGEATMMMRMNGVALIAALVSGLVPPPVAEGQSRCSRADVLELRRRGAS